MENCCKRFPVVGKMILSNLDNQSLVQSKKASRAISNSLENERFYYIRVIQNYEKFNEFEESWKEVFHKTPVDVLKQLAVTIQKYSHDQNSTNGS